MPRQPRSRSIADKKDYKDILFEVKDEVAWITINRPRVLNAFREQTLDEMIDAVKSTREDPSIACAVFTGAGEKAFSEAIARSHHNASSCPPPIHQPLIIATTGIGTPRIAIARPSMRSFHMYAF